MRISDIELRAPISLGGGRFATVIRIDTPRHRIGAQVPGDEDIVWIDIAKVTRSGDGALSVWTEALVMPDLPELPPDYIPRAKRRVILESPYGGDDVDVVIINVRYASACIKDCMSRGEAPLAGHVLYAQNGVLDGRDQEEVNRGIDAAMSWAECAEGTIVYTDRGVTREMRLGIDHARACERNIETRKLGGDWGLCWYPIGRKTPRDDGGECPDDAIGGCELPVGHDGEHE